MSNYLHSAIDTIYRKDDELIIIGLTGRTGSGCSTVAKILCSQKNSIRHSLLDSSSKMSNDARKRRIVAHHFNITWQPFQLIQVRSVITLLLVEQPVEVMRNSLEIMLAGAGVEIEKLIEKLLELKSRHEECNAASQPAVEINFITASYRPYVKKCEKFWAKARS